jgi:hypothetical protein
MISQRALDTLADIERGGVAFLPSAPKDGRIEAV